MFGLGRSVGDNVVPHEEEAGRFSVENDEEERTYRRDAMVRWT